MKEIVSLKCFLCLQGIKQKNPNTPSSDFKLRESFRFSLLINKITILTKKSLLVILKGKFYSKQNNFRLKMFLKKSFNFVNDSFAFYHLCTRFEIQVSEGNGIFYFLI